MYWENYLYTNFFKLNNYNKKKVYYMDFLLLPV